MSNREKKILAKKAKKVGAIYSNHFSRKKLQVFNVFGLIGNISLFIVSVLLIFAILGVVNYGLHKLFDKVDLNTLITAAYTLFGASLTMTVGIFIAIRLSLGNTSEYFNQTESKLFFEVCLFRGMDNHLLGIYSLIYCLAGLIEALLCYYIDAFGHCLISILFSLLLLFRFVIYSRKNKYERFSYYLTNSRYYSDVSKKDKIHDFIMMYDFVDSKGRLKEKQLDIQVMKRSNYIIAYLSELSLKIKRDENILIEQNILEDFYVRFSERIETPIQLFSLLKGIKIYLVCLSKADAHLKKNSEKTKDNIVLVLDNVFQSKIISFSNLDLAIDDLPVFSASVESLFQTLYDKTSKLIIAQGIIISLFQQLIHTVENDELLNNLGKTDLSKEKTILEALVKKNKDNLDSIKTFVKNEEAAVLELLVKLKPLSEDGKKA